MSSSLTCLYDRSCSGHEERTLKNTPRSIPGKDRAFYEELLSKNQSRLFEAGDFMFEILYLVHDESKQSC